MRVLLVYLQLLDNEPMGLMYVGTVLRKAGHLVKITGIDIQNLQEKVLKEVYYFKPDVVGLSITTPLANRAQTVARLIKNNFPRIIIIAGGPHPTILQEETLREGNIDVCVIGEGEVTVEDLLKALTWRRSLEEVKGIAFLKDGNLIVTEARDYIQDLDSLPFVDRELMPRKVIYGRAGYPLGNPCMLLMTVRGCPYQCSFCQPAVDKIFGKEVRRRSYRNVVEEIIALKIRYNIHGLWIDDDTFLFDKNWTEGFCDLMIREKADVLWYANGRVNNVDKDILIKMRDAGCAGLVLTPETGSQRIRNEILNKKVSDEEILRAYQICHEIGLPVQANIMLASPSETDKDLESSIALIKNIQPHFMNLSYTTALPSTYLYERYVQEVYTSKYYKNYEDYDIGVFKKIDTDISDMKLLETHSFFERRYGNRSFINRARHFFRYPYFRKILYKRWKTLIFSRHPKFRHLLFDIVAIIIGSFGYFKNIKLYETDFKTDTIKS